MAKELQRICILSGPSDEVDKTRARVGINYRLFYGTEVPFRILGAGPDLNRALKNSRLLENKAIKKEEYDENMKGLDHHLVLYKFLAEKTGEEIETVTTSVTLVQNVLHGFSYDMLDFFSDGQDGRYAIVTEPWHYKKFKMVENSLKRKGKISQGLEFFNIPSKDLGYYNWIRKVASHIKTRLELMKVQKNLTR